MSRLVGVCHMPLAATLQTCGIITYRLVSTVQATPTTSTFPYRHLLLTNQFTTTTIRKSIPISVESLLSTLIRQHPRATMLSSDRCSFSRLLLTLLLNQHLQPSSRI